MEEVNKALFSITHAEVKPLLDVKHSVDTTVGIEIVHLPEKEVKNAQGFVYHFHAARLFPANPSAQNFVVPHYHLKGIEPYHILSGDGGEMNLGVVNENEVIWEKPRMVKVGELIEVQEGQAHSLHNVGETPIDFTFACPDMHLVDHSSQSPEGDRFFTKDFKNGCPGHFITKV